MTCEHHFDYETDRCRCGARRFDFYADKFNHFAFTVVTDDNFRVLETALPLHDDGSFSPGYSSNTTPYVIRLMDAPAVGQTLRPIRI